MKEVKFEVMHNNKHFGYEKINSYGEWEWCCTELNPDNMIRWSKGVIQGDNIRRQSTGLLDKNGKEIYEGDIIQSFDSQDYEITHIIEYSDEGAKFNAKHKGFGNCGVSQKWITEFEKEIIGNIYENPELLNPPSNQIK